MGQASLPHRTSKERSEMKARQLGCTPKLRMSTNYGEIFVATSDKPLPADRDYLKPHYLGMWVVGRGEQRIDFGRTVYFDVDHDKEKNFTEDFRARMRVSSCLSDAFGFLRAYHARRH